MQEGEFTIKLNGVDHWVKIAGQGRPILLLHGGPGGNHWVFEHTIGPDLESFCQLIYLESRGCGRSAPPEDGDCSIEVLCSDIDALLNHLELSQVILMGHSFGAGLATAYALQKPDRVVTLLLQAPLWFGEDPSAFQTRGFLPFLKSELLEAVLEMQQRKVAEQDILEFIWNNTDSETADLFLFQNQQVAVLNRQLWQQSGLVNTGEMHQFLLDHPPEPLHWRLSELPMPVLILMGAHDRNISLSRVQELSREIPEVHLKVFEHSAHFPDLEEPELYKEAVRSFLLLF